MAHKTGNLGGIVHDVGIVYAPDAPFVIALLAEDAWDYAEVAGAWRPLSVTASSGAGTVRVEYQEIIPASP